MDEFTDVIEKHKKQVEDHVNKTADRELGVDSRLPTVREIEFSYKGVAFKLRAQGVDEDAVISEFREIKDVLINAGFITT